MTGHLFSQATSRTIYPTNHVVAIIDELEDAQEAIEALRQGGFEESDILLVTGLQSEETLHKQGQRWHLFERVMHLVTNVVSDESPYQELCEHAMKHGHHLISVLTLHDKEQQLAATILKNHQGHSIKFFGWWAITSHL